MILVTTTQPMTDFMTSEYVVVNPVNRMGAMGAGVAKWFRDNMPKEFFDLYTYYCKTNQFEVGNVFLWSGGMETDHEYHVANVPSKHHWREQSDLLLIEKGLQRLDYTVAQWNKTIVTTKIGCGLGGLSWPSVRPILNHLRSDVIVATGVLQQPPKYVGYKSHVMLRNLS